MQHGRRTRLSVASGRRPLTRASRLVTSKREALNQKSFSILSLRFRKRSNLSRYNLFFRKDVGVHQRFTKPLQVPVVLVSVMLLGVSGCSMKEAAELPASPARAAGGMSKSAGDSSKTGADAAIAGKIEIDGSSTVYPISQAVAEEFMKEHPKVTVRVNISGTGGGFKRFKDGDLDICDASRPIEKNELEACQKNNVAFVNLKIGIDGISVVVNPQNTWCKSLTVEQLKKLWQAGSKIKTWNEVDPSFPNQKIILYGPDTDSGTFDYFTEVICGKRGNSRTDYTPNSNDNVLIQGVQGDAGRWAILASPITSSTKRRFAPFRLPPRRGAGRSQ